MWNVLGTICFDFIGITLSKDALRTICDRVRSVFGRNERVRNRKGRYKIVLLTTTRSHYVPDCPLYDRRTAVTLQYDHLVFGTMALRLISEQDGFSNLLTRFKILRGHLDQTRPYSSNNVRKQISIGCYYHHSVFTLFKPVRFELLGRTEDEYKCNRGNHFMMHTNVYNIKQLYLFGVYSHICLGIEV